MEEKEFYDKITEKINTYGFETVLIGELIQIKSNLAK